jgi:hypothetical protein
MRKGDRKPHLRGCEKVLVLNLSLILLFALRPERGKWRAGKMKIHVRHDPVETDSPVQANGRGAFRRSALSGVDCPLNPVLMS